MIDISLLYKIFGVIFALYLLADLFIFNQRAKAPSLRSTITQTISAIGIAVVFALVLWGTGHTTEAVEFTTVYITEKMLSLDNLFVMLVIFQFFNVERRYQHRVLFFGILGAIVFRLLFISLGSVLIENIGFMMYIFAALLVWTGYKILKSAGKSENDTRVNDEHTKVTNFLKKYLPYTTQDHQGKFLLKVNGKNMFTSLAFALIVIEISDIMFAIDSIPAAFSITSNIWIIFTANIAAILGLRSLFFVVEFLLERLKYLNYGLGIVLIYIGLKFAIAHWYHIDSVVSLIVIGTILGFVALLSLYKTRKKASF